MAAIYIEYVAQRGHSLGNIEKLRKLEVAKGKLTARAVPVASSNRAGEIRPSLLHEDAPRQAGRRFIIPKIVE